jgi:HrpA-like RNA helicase
VDLQSTLLKIKSLNLTHPTAESPTLATLLSQAPEPPPLSSIHLALQQLNTLGALEADETLTPLGSILSQLPLDPWMSKLLITASLFDQLETFITLASIMSLGRGIYSIV